MPGDQPAKAPTVQLRGQHLNTQAKRKRPLETIVIMTSPGKTLYNPFKDVPHNHSLIQRLPQEEKAYANGVATVVGKISTSY